MKHLRHLALCLLLVLTMATSAFAAEVPESLVVENLNGQQRIVKTYVLPPEADPDTLKEPSFDYDGFTYTWAYTTKEEQPYLDSKTVTETVTVETSSNDLSDILAALAPSIPYDDGEYVGVLTLDHTTLSTEAAGYTTKYGSITETKVIGNLDRNDMSYVPATTVKNGRTLKLSSVDWQVTGTALVGEALVPSQYQAVATYSASTSWQAATGYVTTAEYHGEVTSEGIESITYTVIYAGTEIVPEEPEPLPVDGDSDGNGIPDADENSPSGLAGSPLIIIGLLMLLLLLGILGVLLFLRRKNVYVYVPGDKPRDYKLIAKFRADLKYPNINLCEVEPYPTGTVAIELKRSLAKDLEGKEFQVHCQSGVHGYIVLQGDSDDWHEFDVETLQPIV